MAEIIALVLLAGAAAYFIASGIVAEGHDPHYPRERRILMVQKLGEEFGWWSYRDMFGLHQSRDWLPPEHEESAVMKLSELLGTETASEIRQKRKTEELLGG